MCPNAVPFNHHLCVHLVCLGFILILRAETLVQWLYPPAWKFGDCGFEPNSGIQVSKKQSVSSPLTRKGSPVWPTCAQRWPKTPFVSFHYLDS